MSPDSLPYTVLILLVELALGALAFTTYFDARRMVTQGYVQMGAMVVLPSLALAAWLYTAIDIDREIDGYTLRTSALDAFRVTLAVFVAAAALHLVAAFASKRQAGRIFGAGGTVAGVLTVASLAAVIELPAWSYVGVLGSMLTASIVVGGTLMAMSWGHWYLTNSGLPKEPLQQMSLVVLGSLVLQAVFVALAVAFPAREVPFSESAFNVALGQNPAFWLRVGVGLVFPAVLAWFAYQAASIRGMMSATGLLYIATGAVLAGEVLARGLLFATGAPV